MGETVKRILSRAWAGVAACAWLLVGVLAAGQYGRGAIASGQVPAKAEKPPLDLLVVAPHPDDEALGCTGVMLQAIEKKKRVGVVLVTNGDGFPKAAAIVSKKSAEQLVPFELGNFRVVSGYPQVTSGGQLKPAKIAQSRRSRRAGLALIFTVFQRPGADGPLISETYHTTVSP